MILALQFCNGDLDASMRLARLLTDLEPRYRSDVGLLLIYQPDTIIDERVYSTFSHCKTKFPCDLVKSQYGAPGWANGSGQLWRGAMTWCHDLWLGVQSQSYGGIEPRRHSSVFTFDGGDGIPLHNNWIDLMIAQHQITRQSGRMVSGRLTLDVPAYPHINGNMIIELVMWALYPRLRDTPQEASAAEFWKCWDIYHAIETVPNSSPSTIVTNKWNSRGVSIAVMNSHAGSSIWLHGYKDEELHDIARQRLLGRLEGLPTVPCIEKMGNFSLPFSDWAATLT